MPSAIQFHRSVSSAVRISKLKEHICFVAINNAANRVANEMPPVPGARCARHRRKLHASEPVVISPGVLGFGSADGKHQPRFNWQSSCFWVIGLRLLVRVEPIFKRPVCKHHDIGWSYAHCVICVLPKQRQLFLQELFNGAPRCVRIQHQFLVWNSFRGLHF
jgi:hypothetical protein